MKDIITTVSIDGYDSPIVTAIVDLDDTWNGWLRPRVGASTMRAFAERISADDSFPFTIVETEETHFGHPIYRVDNANDADDDFALVPIAAEGIYDLSDLGWTWDCDEKYDPDFDADKWYADQERRARLAGYLAFRQFRSEVDADTLKETASEQRANPRYSAVDNVVDGNMLVHDAMTKTLGREPIYMTNPDHRFFTIAFDELLAILVDRVTA